MPQLGITTNESSKKNTTILRVEKISLTLYYANFKFVSKRNAMRVRLYSTAQPTLSDYALPSKLRRSHAIPETNQANFFY